jgi:hypothetical protein
MASFDQTEEESATVRLTAVALSPAYLVEELDVLVDMLASGLLAITKGWFSKPLTPR